MKDFPAGSAVRYYIRIKGEYSHPVLDEIGVRSLNIINNTAFFTSEVTDGASPFPYLDTLDRRGFWRTAGFNINGGGYGTNNLSSIEGVLGNITFKDDPLDLTMSFYFFNYSPDHSDEEYPGGQRYVGKIKQCGGKNERFFIETRDAKGSDIPDYLAWDNNYYQLTNELYGTVVNGITFNDKGIFTQLSGRDFILKVVNFDAVTGQPKPNKEPRKLALGITGGGNGGTESLKRHILPDFDIVYEGGPNHGRSIIHNAPHPTFGAGQYQNVSRNSDYTPDGMNEFVFFEFPVGQTEMKLKFKNFVTPRTLDNGLIRLSVLAINKAPTSTQESAYVTQRISDSFSIRPSKLVVERALKADAKPITAGTVIGVKNESRDTMSEAYPELEKQFSKLKLIPVGEGNKRDFGYRAAINMKFKIKFNDAAHEAACKSHPNSLARINYLEGKNIRVNFNQFYDYTEENEPGGVIKTNLVLKNIDLPNLNMGYYDPTTGNDWGNEEMESMASLLGERIIDNGFYREFFHYTGLAFPDVGHYMLEVDDIDKTFAASDANRGDCRKETPGANNDVKDAYGRIGCYIPLKVSLDLGDVVPRKIILTNVKVKDNMNNIINATPLSNEKGMSAIARFDLAALPLNYTADSYFDINREYKDANGNYNDSRVLRRPTGDNAFLSFNLPWKRDVKEATTKLFSKDCFAEDVKFDASLEERIYKKYRDASQPFAAIEDYGVDPHTSDNIYPNGEMRLFQAEGTNPIATKDDNDPAHTSFTVKAENFIDGILQDNPATTNKDEGVTVGFSFTRDSRKAKEPFTVYNTAFTAFGLADGRTHVMSNPYHDLFNGRTMTLTDSGSSSVKFFYAIAYMPDATGKVGEAYNFPVYNLIYCGDCDKTKYGITTLSTLTDSTWYPTDNSGGLFRANQWGIIKTDNAAQGGVLGFRSPLQNKTVATGTYETQPISPNGIRVSKIVLPATDVTTQGIDNVTFKVSSWLGFNPTGSNATNVYNLGRITVRAGAVAGPTTWGGQLFEKNRATGQYEKVEPASNPLENSTMKNYKRIEW